MFLLWIFAAYVLLLLIVRVFERRMIFVPDYPGRLEGDWRPQTLGPEDVWLTSSDGTKLRYWWVSEPNARFPFLAFHGVKHRQSCADIRVPPANVLALEYRGYGQSEANRAQQAFIWTQKRRISISSRKGSSIRSRSFHLANHWAPWWPHLAADRVVGGVILEAPFPSAARVASTIYWFLPGLSLFVHGQVDMESNLRKIVAPILIVHCLHNPVILFQFGQQVYTSAHAPKQFVQIDGACHEEASLIDPVQYRAAFQSFLGSLTATR
jgi:hypothetical protein